MINVDIFDVKNLEFILHHPKKMTKHTLMMNYTDYVTLSVVYCKMISGYGLLYSPYYIFR